MKTNWINFGAMGVMVFFLAGDAPAQQTCTLELESLAASTNGSSADWSALGRGRKH